MIRVSHNHRISLILGLSICSASAGGDDALKQRVLTEYPAALAKLEARYGSMHGQGRHHKFRVIQPMEQTLKLDFAFAPGSAKMVTTETDPDSPAIKAEQAFFQSIYCANPRYGFHLNRRHPDDELTLRDVSDDRRYNFNQISSHFGNQVQCAFTLSFVSVSFYLDQKTFRIDSVAELVEESGGKLLLIRFAIVRPPGTPTRPNWIDTDGWLVVSPDEGWIMREYGRVLTARGKSYETDIGKIEYTRSPDGHLDPIKHTQRNYHGRVNRDNPGTPGAGFELIFESVKYEALPESEFRLPAFGMPEVEAAGKKGASTKLSYGLFGLAIVGFGLAGGCKYAASRLRRA